jgi:hypothetical protein
VAERLALLLRIREIPGSNLSQESAILTEVPRGFLPPPQANDGIVSQIMSRLKSSIFWRYDAPFLLSFPPTFSLVSCLAHS